jgi:hypothetical protein
VVQLIESRPHFIPEGDVVFVTVSRSITDPDSVLAEWRCSAHAGPILRGQMGKRSKGKEVQSAFAEAVAYAHEHQIEFMVIEDPEGLFPPTQRFQATCVPPPGLPSKDSTDSNSEDDDTLREGRLRTLAARQGLYLGKSRTRDPSASDYGRYILFSDPSRAVAEFGADKRGPVDIGAAGYEATLEEIEAFLARGEEQGRP